MRRREFITLVGGAAAWPVTAQTQQVERPRRIGVLMSMAESDRNAPARIGSFLRGLEQLGWIEGHNIRLDLRWAAGDLDLSSKRYAAELVALAPDVLLATAGPTVAALQAETRTVPIVFAHAVDPVGAGFVASLARAQQQCDRVYLVRVQHRCEMAGVAQRLCTQRYASGGSSRSYIGSWDRPVRGYSSGGLVSWGRIEHNQRAQPR